MKQPSSPFEARSAEQLVDHEPELLSSSVFCHDDNIIGPELPGK